MKARIRELLQATPFTPFSLRTILLLSLASLVGCTSTRGNRSVCVGPLSTPIVVIDEYLVFVGGEVKSPGRQVWSPGLTLTKAIERAGGFTEFAHRRAIEIRHADGATHKHNYSLLLKQPELDPELKPNDHIMVRYPPY